MVDAVKTHPYVSRFRLAERRDSESAQRADHVGGACAIGCDLKEACWRPSGGFRDPSAAIFPLVTLSRPQEAGKVVRGSGGD